MEITIQEEKINHFTFHKKKKGPITSHENALYHPHRFYQQQPVPSDICGPATHAQIQFVNECHTAQYSFSLRQIRFLRTEMFNRFDQLYSFVSCTFVFT